MSEEARRQRSEPFGHYGPSEVARLAGITPDRAPRWLIRPSRGRSPHVYSLADAAEGLVAHFDRGRPRLRRRSPRARRVHTLRGARAVRL
jgi:hypothetical protein